MKYKCMFCETEISKDALSIKTKFLVRFGDLNLVCPKTDCKLQGNLLRVNKIKPSEFLKAREFAKSLKEEK